MDSKISKLEENLKVKFNNPDLLKQALVHRSYINENPDFSLKDNERLEFLGDAVLELIVTEYLYQNYPNPEGDLTTWRAALVNAKFLSKIAKGLGVNECLLLSKGESKDENGRARRYILADAFEALIGAIYLDQGYQKTIEFIEREILKALPLILEKNLYKDPKSRFQEKAQELSNSTPEYKVIKEWGPDHDKNFKVGVYINNELIAQGEGSSKQEAEEEAAQAALEKKGWE